VVAGVEQAGDDQAEGRYGLRAVPAAVVFEDDGPGTGVAEDVASDV
jgi:hypothetical protein